MESIYNKTREQYQIYFENNNIKKYRATQLFEWLYKNKIKNINDISNIDLNTLDLISNNFVIDNLKLLKKEESKDVIKYLWELKDKQTIESVVMFHNYGNSLCVSTQVGCNMNCSFCESGKTKKQRNLETSEMVLQLLEVEKDLKERISHIVLMGIGEPLDNYNNVLDFINILNDHKGFEIGIRHITLSTCGIVPKIEDIIDNNFKFNLAISLHAPNDEIRDKLMPINKIYNISDIINIVKKYNKVLRKRITFEYLLIDNVNDKREHALELLKLVKDLNCYINLIPYNETSKFNYKRSKNIENFKNILKDNNINVNIRKEYGGSISAACGQLRANEEDK